MTRRRRRTGVDPGREPRDTSAMPAKVSAPAERRLKWPTLPKPAPIEWICLVVGLFLTIHYSWLIDDAFIYFRYVDNLLHLKYGLVYNAGEYVEGFSSPLWTMLLIVLRATGLNFWVITRLVGLAAFALFWLLLVVLNRRLSPPQTPTMNFPLCYLTFNYGVLCYFTSGLEAPLVQVAAVVYALWVLSPGSRALQLLLAVTPILRHELALPFGICLVWLWIRQKRFPWQVTLAGLLISGSWVVFRIHYYADLFPNTFYLKDTVDFAQGLLYLHDTAEPYWLYAVFGIFVLLTLACVLKDRTSAPGSLEIGKRVLMIVLAVSIAAYVVKIGGDPRHYRYLAFPFCLGICACAGIGEQVVSRFALLRFRVGPGIVGVLIGLGAVSCYPRQLSDHPFFGKETTDEVDRIRDAARHRRRETLPTTPWGSGSDWELKELYVEFREARGDRGYTGLRASGYCALLYREFYKRAVQYMGLTEPILARTEMKADRPAHKLGLRPLGRQLARIIDAFGNAPRKGMYRQAVGNGIAPQWIADNLESIEIIEQKMFNTHDFVENLRLAFTFPEKIKP